MKTNKDVYETCPTFENDHYKLRLTERCDISDLLMVYSDKQAVPYFNADNCGGDTFYYTTYALMKEAIDYWLLAYQEKWFVRWTILDHYTQRGIGTVELFHRDSEKDALTNCGLLRLDLSSSFEKEQLIKDILSLIIQPVFELFHCERIATKAIPDAKERIKALQALGFKPSAHKLIGNDGKEYAHYYSLDKQFKHPA